MRNNKPLMSLILPTYNEVDNIATLVKKIKLQLNDYYYEILVIDDDSPDKTAEIVKKKFREEEKIRIFIRKRNKGLAKAIFYGINRCHGDLILVMDTDFNHNPKDVPLFLSYKENYDMVIGSRYIEGGGMENTLRYLLSLIYNLVVRLILNLKTHDNLSGFFIIKREALNKLPLNKIFYGYGEYFMRLLFFAHQYNLKIAEIPVFYKNRKFGESKSRFLPMFFDYSKTVLKLLLQK